MKGTLSHEVSTKGFNECFEKNNCLKNTAILICSEGLPTASPDNTPNMSAVKKKTQFNHCLKAICKFCLHIYAFFGYDASRFSMVIFFHYIIFYK